jgi:Carboxypeptidase regulatory-like domain/TonB-dependent Receptor Plug Domain
MRRSFLFVVALLLAGSGLALAQGSQTGVLTGTVKSADGQPLPGVTVTVKSPALIGARSTVTDANGGYILKGLAPGGYTTTFEISGFSTVEKKTNVALGENANVDASLTVATVQETVTVTAEAPSILTTNQGGQNLQGKEVDTLATGRTLSAITELAPGLTSNSPNSGQVTIGGAFSYDNVWLIDGVEVNDNLFGSANDVYIEDAIQETQVLTSGISAEYGRFSGGVINALSKRGGNDFSGSFRTDFTNASWTAQSPYEKHPCDPTATCDPIDRKSSLNKFYSETLGGPIFKDRLWFFAAARQEASTTQDTFSYTGIAHSDMNDNKRFEGRLSGAVTPNHNLQFGYTRNNTTNTSPSFSFSIDPNTINTTVEPNDLFVGSYNGVLKSNLFLEAQYSQQKFEFAQGGGTSTDLVDSPFLTFSQALGQYNAPYFANTLDPETRKNRQLTASLSYFLTTSGLGKHDLKGGFENYRTTGIGGNSQSSTEYVYYADYKTNAAGDPTLDPQGHLIPVFANESDLFIHWTASRGAQLDITTNSFYLNDHWTLSHWAFNVGARYEKVRSEATGGIIGVDTDTIVPRLGAVYDVKGDGKYTLQASYAHYAGGYNQSQIGNNTKVGNPSYVYGIYVGPSGEGRDFAPGFDTNNYVFLGAGLPDGNVSFANGMSSPVTKEFTVGGGVSLSRGGFVKALYVHRKTTNFIEDFIDIGEGKVDLTLPPTPCIGCDGTVTLDNRVFRNSDIPERSYSALQLQTAYRLTDRWSFSGNWTYQFAYDGDFEGENTNQPAITSVIGNYPEIFTADRNYPTGHLLGFQRNKVRAWTTYDLRLGRLGDLNIGLLYRYDSPLSYSLAAAKVPLSDIQVARDPGYATPPQNQTLYFGDRGIGFYNGASLFDVALTYDIKIWKTLKPYVKFDLRNAFNNDSLVQFDTTVTADNNGPKDANGLPLNYIKGPKFGQAIANSSYPTQRTYRFALGFRF